MHFYSLNVLDTTPIAALPKTLFRIQCGRTARFRRPVTFPNPTAIISIYSFGAAYSLRLRFYFYRI